EPVGLVRSGEVEVRHLLDVGTGGEGLVAAGDDDRLDLVIGVERGGRIGDVGEHLQVERVERLRPVDGDRGDAGVDIGEDGCVFAHENTFSSWSVVRMVSTVSSFTSAVVAGLSWGCRCLSSSGER